MADSRLPQPLVDNQKIVREDGTPTEYFIRWAQQRQIDISEGITRDQAIELIQEWAAERSVIAGTGLSGGGTLDADVTITLDAILGQLNDVDLTTTPPTDGQALVWNAADSKWVPGAGGGGGGGGSGIKGITSMYRTANQAIPSATWRDVYWDAEDFDNLGALDITNGQFTVPPGIALMRVSANIVWAFQPNSPLVSLYNNTTGTDVLLSLIPAQYESGRATVTQWLEVTPGDVWTIRVNSSGTSTVIGGSPAFNFGAPSRAQVEWSEGFSKLIGAGGGGGGGNWWFNPPTTATFATFSGDGTIPVLVDDDDVGLIVEYGNTNNGGTIVRAGLTNPPIGDYSIVARMDIDMPVGNYAAGGITLVETGTGKCHMNGVTQGSLYQARTFTVSGGFSAATTYNTSWATHWFRTDVDFTNNQVRSYFSTSGKRWVLYETRALNSIFTTAPDKIGIGGWSSGQPGVGFVCCDSWEVA